MRRWLRSKVCFRVIVHTVEDTSIEGILTAEAPDGLVLESAALIGDTRTPLAGQTFIPRAQIHLVQFAPDTNTRLTPA